MWFTEANVNRIGRITASDEPQAQGQPAGPEGPAGTAGTAGPAGALGPQGPAGQNGQVELITCKTVIKWVTKRIHGRRRKVRVKRQTCTRRLVTAHARR